MSPSPRTRFRRALLGVVAAAVWLAGVELLVRGAGALVLRVFVPSPEVRDYIASNRVVYDPELGWRPAALAGPADTVWLGLGAADLPAQPPAGRTRAFAFGDSQTQGGGVERAEAWPARTEAILRDRGLDIEILNAGAPGFRSAQVLRLIETRVMAWHPDLLLVDCRVGDSPRLERQGGGVLAPILFRSHLYRLLWLGVATARGQDLGLPGSGRIEQPELEGQTGEGNHGALAALAGRWGVDLVFLDYPHRQNLADLVIAGAPAGQLPPGVPVAEATGALMASGVPGNDLFFDANHLTVEGNLRVARVVADVVEPILRR